MIEPIIVAEKMKIIYNEGKSNEVRALEETNIKIFPKEYVIIFGPSGCGKSTLLYSAAALQRPTDGEMIIKGTRLSKMTPKQELELHQVGIGMIFQAFYLIPSLTILDNVCLPKTFRGEGVRERRIAGMKLLRRFGIAEQAHKFPSELSGGQKQRVAIARSLINDPEIILADEPTGALDSESARNVLKILKELNEVDKKTIIMVTHNPEHLLYADRVIHMKDGRIVNEDIHIDKRPTGIEEEVEASSKVTVESELPSDELKMLTHSFKNLSTQQLNVLLVPFKAKQLMHHVLSELTEEQVGIAESLVKEILFRNINISDLPHRLDEDLDLGGAGWNHKRAQFFSARIQSMLDQVQIIQESPDTAVESTYVYLENMFHFKIDEQQQQRFQHFLRQRLESRINRFELRRRLDTSRIRGGVGLYKNTAEKVAQEVEILMLLKYS